MKKKERLRAVHTEILLLVFLSVATVPLFLFTRAMAARNREMHARVAEVSYREGNRRLESGDVAGAIESFRKATTNSHDDPEYRLALGRALARQGSAPEARVTLLQLREAAPEDGEINLELARVMAKMEHLEDAVRYYHNALYGIWPEEEIARRRREVRVELIEFLLGRGEATAALSELLVFSPDIPDTVTDRVVAGRWFLAAGDSRRALDQFTLALKLDDKSGEALEGAGEAAFQREDYARAVQYLQGAPRGPVRDRLLNASRQVLSEDPLASRIGTRERQRRLARLFERAEQRVAECVASLKADGAVALSALQMEAAALEPGLTQRRIAQDSELVRVGLDLAYRLQRSASEACGSAGEDQALFLISRLHGLAGNE